MCVTIATRIDDRKRPRRTGCPIKNLGHDRTKRLDSPVSSTGRVAYQVRNNEIRRKNGYYDKTPSLAFGGIGVFYRVLFLIRKDRHIEAAYTELYEIIKELKRNIVTQREIRFGDLQEWLPKTKASILKICWKQLQKNEVILKDDSRWIVGNKSQQVV